MINYKTSIFNDVLGPVMTGPSSSHTAGPGRIGYFAGCLMPDYKSVQLIFPKTVRTLPPIKVKNQILPLPLAFLVCR